MHSYKELRDALEEMAATVKKFPDAIQPRVLELLINSFTGGNGNSSYASGAAAAKTTAKNGLDARAKNSPQPAVKADAPRAPTKRGSGNESYQIDRNLNLRGDGTVPAFKKFVMEKAPVSAKEFNVVAAYYLQRILGLSDVTLNQIYTCYAEANKRPPGAFRQSLLDAKNKQGWVEFDAKGFVKVPHRGIVFVEHDLPAKPRKANSKT